MSHKELLEASMVIMDEVEEAYKEEAAIIQESHEAFEQWRKEADVEVRPWEKPRPANESSLDKWVVRKI